MLLIVTGRDDVTADLVTEQLAKLGQEFVRFNTEDYPTVSQLTFEFGNKGTSGRFVIAGKDLKFDAIRTVWFRKPNPPRISESVTNPQARSFAQQESETVLSGFYRILAERFWVSRPDAIRRANDKLCQLAIAQNVGFNIPRTLVTNNPRLAKEFALSTKTAKVIKPLKAGQVEYPDGRIELIYTSVMNSADIANIHQVAFAPCLLQEYVSKEYEVRATIIGQRVFAVGLDTQGSEISRYDWRRDNSSGVRYFETTLPDDIIAKCFTFMDHYNLQFSAFDFVKTPDGDYVFLENNPNGQWAWLDLELGNGMIRYMADFLIKGDTGEYHRVS